MKVRYHVEKGLFEIDGAEFLCESFPRNELNKKRPRDARDIFFGRDREGNIFPTMPRPFPKGKFHIIEIRKVPKKHPERRYLGAYYIATDAFQWLPVWRYKKGRGYLEPTKELRLDSGYGFHFCPYSTSTSSQGCGLFRETKALNAVIKLLKRDLAQGSVSFIVL